MRVFCSLAMVLLTFTGVQAQPREWDIKPVPVQPWRPVESKSTDNLNGTWLREFEGMQVILKFTERRAALEVRFEGNDLPICVRVLADYAANAEGVFFGQITKAELDLPPGLEKLVVREPLLESFLGRLRGEPFRVQYRIHEKTLSIRDAKGTIPNVTGLSVNEKILRNMLTGEFKSVRAEAMPKLKPVTAKAESMPAMTPNARMTQLLNESEDMRAAREEWHRFWMNNQPSVLTYERLNGAIGP